MDNSYKKKKMYISPFSFRSLVGSYSFVHQELRDQLTELHAKLHERDVRLQEMETKLQGKEAELVASDAKWTEMQVYLKDQVEEWQKKWNLTQTTLQEKGTICYIYYCFRV